MAGARRQPAARDADGANVSAHVYINNESFNYTHNVSRLWYDHIPDTGKGGGLRELDGLTGRQAFAVLADCISSIEETRLRLWCDDTIGEPKFCAAYDARNGWGSAVGGLLFLSLIMAACAKNPRHRVRVSL